MSSWGGGTFGGDIGRLGGLRRRTPEKKPGCHIWVRGCGAAEAYRRDRFMQPGSMCSVGHTIAPNPECR